MGGMSVIGGMGSAGGIPDKPGGIDIPDVIAADASNN